jgi:hypothetical protein
MRTLASELRPFAAKTVSVPRVYADANSPAGVVESMRRVLGWDVLFVIEDPALRRAADREHFSRALDLGRTLITLDRDFCDDRAFPPALSPGVIVCSAPDAPALLRMLRHAERTWLGVPAGDLPLKGRKVCLTMDMVAAGEPRTEKLRRE